MLSNYIYAGNYKHRKRIQNEETILLENVCPAIIDKHGFELVQKQKEKNLKNYTRKHTYVYMQKIVCSKCNNIMGGSSTTSKNKPTQIYYKCNCCNTRINEKKIDKQEDEIDDLKEKNYKLQSTIDFFENLFDRLVKFIKDKIFGKEKGREDYWNFSKNLYAHKIFSDKTIESIQDDYIWNKENDKDKNKGKDDYEIGM